VVFYGAKGSTLVKAIGYYVTALKEAGIIDKRVNDNLGQSSNKLF